MGKKVICSEYGNEFDPKETKNGNTKCAGCQMFG